MKGVQFVVERASSVRYSFVVALAREANAPTYWLLSPSISLVKNGSLLSLIKYVK
jgi:hypothetical protein